MDLSTVTEYRLPADRSAAHERDPATAVIGGGTWLFSEPQPHLTRVIDLTALGWPSLERHDDGSLTLAATITLFELATLPVEVLGRAHPLFRQCCEGLLASEKIWRQATLGGNVGAALAAGATIALLSALDAEALIWTPDGGERRMPVPELILGQRQLALDPGEIIRGFNLSAAALASETGYRKIALSPLGRTGTLLAARRSPAGDLTVVVTGGTTRPEVLRFGGHPTADEVAEAVHGIRTWFTDAHGAADWREAVSAQFAEELRRELTGPAAGSDADKDTHTDTDTDTDDATGAPTGEATP